MMWTKREREAMAVLAREMDSVATQLDALPEVCELTLEDGDTLESLRHGALRLARTVEAIFEDLQGKGG